MSFAFARSTNIESRLRVASRVSRLITSRMSALPRRTATKLASMRPFGLQ
jgi:hypothetical protein